MLQGLNIHTPRLSNTIPLEDGDDLGSAVVRDHKVIRDKEAVWVGHRNASSLLAPSSLADLYNPRKISLQR